MWVVMRRRLIIIPVLAIAAVLNYFAWLGWDQHRDLQPDGSSTGPYQAWQVVGLVAVLGGLAWIAGRVATPWIGSAALASVMTACFSIDAATHSESDGLWLVGAVLVLVGTALGALTVATITFHRGRRATTALHG